MRCVSSRLFILLFIFVWTHAYLLHTLDYDLKLLILLFKLFSFGFEELFLFGPLFPWHIPINVGFDLLLSTSLLYGIIRSFRLSLNISCPSSRIRNFFKEHRTCAFKGIWHIIINKPSKNLLMLIYNHYSYRYEYARFPHICANNRALWKCLWEADLARDCVCKPVYKHMYVCVYVSVPSLSDNFHVMWLPIELEEENAIVAVGFSFFPPSCWTFPTFFPSHSTAGFHITEDVLWWGLKRTFPMSSNGVQATPVGGELEVENSPKVHLSCFPHLQDNMINTQPSFLIFSWHVKAKSFSSSFLPLKF